MNDVFLLKKLHERQQQHAFRRLELPAARIDFCSNDYLGIVHHRLIEKHQASRYAGQSFRHGATGSRLISGNYPLLQETEAQIAAFHQAVAGLLYNSGYDANVGLLSCVPQRGDTILYDYLSHASLRDGIRLSFAQAFSFRHNDLDDLEKKLRGAGGHIFVVTESVFSMDGDMAPLAEMSALCLRYGAYLIVDEAHATGVVGPQGVGLVQQLGLQDACFARVNTFGKAVGCHGAIVLGSAVLRDYLINFSRSFIYSTAMPESSAAAIRSAYAVLPGMEAERAHLRELIDLFQQASCAWEKLPSATPIQVIMAPGNDRVKQLAEKIQKAGMDVRPIMYPTVPAGKERLRIVLHAFNTREEVERLINLLQ
jgi:7-keto-8-aminopelargonate synthetase and related enzymes